ncbi:hypothetical protein B566_EDAN009124 [Ephemera danica]|nr:hypothetical protein B566_EDAN009124 [Ephemera danica]
MSIACRKQPVGTVQLFSEGFVEHKLAQILSGSSMDWSQSLTMLMTYFLLVSSINHLSFETRLMFSSSQGSVNDTAVISSMKSVLSLQLLLVLLKKVWEIRSAAPESVEVRANWLASLESVRIRHKTLICHSPQFSKCLHKFVNDIFRDVRSIVLEQCNFRLLTWVVHSVTAEEVTCNTDTMLDLPRAPKKSLPRKGNPGLFAKTIILKSGCIGIIPGRFFTALGSVCGTMRRPSDKIISPDSTRVWNINNNTPVKLNVFPGSIEQEKKSVCQLVLADSLVTNQQKVLSQLEVLQQPLQHSQVLHQKYFSSTNFLLYCHLLPGGHHRIIHRGLWILQSSQISGMLCYQSSLSYHLPDSMKVVLTWQDKLFELCRKAAILRAILNNCRVDREPASDLMVGSSEFLNLSHLVVEEQCEQLWSQPLTLAATWKTIGSISYANKSASLCTVMLLPEPLGPMRHKSLAQCDCSSSASSEAWYGVSTKPGVSRIGSGKPPRNACNTSMKFTATHTHNHDNSPPLWSSVHGRDFNSLRTMSLAADSRLSAGKSGSASDSDSGERKGIEFRDVARGGINRSTPASWWFPVLATPILQSA